MKRYNPLQIEKKWQAYWAKHKLFVASDKAKKPKRYILVEFPYPSGEGLHMGHLRPYVAGDVSSRYFRLKGYEVIYPIGWDAFGLPAENYAIKQGVQPKISTAQNIKNAKRQVNSWGMSFDWSREVNTTDPKYYKWTQWIFLQFFKAGLAYEATGEINWCPQDKTGLANEEVIDGCCERCGVKVGKKQMRQWYLKITAYAEKLLQGLKTLNWPEHVKLQQENWIGKSEGAEIEFRIKNQASSVKVFTTRPDTLFGATYLVLAPEHPLIQNQESRIKNYEEVEEYIAEAKNKSELQRTAAEKEKTGVELKGVKAVNPATKEEIPVWVADYVLMNYGTGAIMAVPAHDERDFAFAKKFRLPVRSVIAPTAALNQNAKSKNQNYNLKFKIADTAFPGEGFLINSGKFTGMKSKEAVWRMAKEFGWPAVQYKLRDWVFSRQRYWGEPIPLIHCPKCGTVSVPEKALPVKLPEVKKYQPTGTGESPLAAIAKWVNVKCPKCQGPAKRETNTMPQWAGSSWYWLRYTDPKNKKEFASFKKQKSWTPVDTYFGGMEHTTLHLLYSRFWNLFLYDQKLAPAKEPYILRVPHGIVLGPDGEKMSKSRGNVVNPDSVVKQYGADTLRMYELFLGPHEAQVAWNDRGIVGVSRFLDRVWVWAQENKNQEARSKKQNYPTPNPSPRAGRGRAEVVDSEGLNRALHRLIKKVGEDIENYRFNTAISALMEFYNQVKDQPISRQSLKAFLMVLYPFAPHLAEELNRLLGGKKSLQLESWPKFDPKLVLDDLADIVVQVNGKVRDKIQVALDSGEEEVREKALALDKIKTAVAGKSIKRVVFVQNRLINFVIIDLTAPDLFAGAGR